MKKIIIISILTSTILFSVPEVSNLSVDQTNRQDALQVDLSTIIQGKTDIIGNSTKVTDLTITQEATGNIIEQSTITNSAVIQGETEVRNNARVNNVEINSDSTIIGQFNDSVVSQGDTEIDSSIVTNLQIESSNTINGTQIDGGFVEQGTLFVTDSNASDSDASNIDIKSINTISNGAISGDSELYQSYTEIVQGSTVNGLNLTQTNSVENTLEDDLSGIYQSYTLVDNSTLSNLTQTVVNNISDTIIQDSNISYSGLEQANIDIRDGSHVQNVNVLTTNNIEGARTYDSTVKQNGLYVDNSSTVNTLAISENNHLDNSDLSESEFGQGNININ